MTCRHIYSEPMIVEFLYGPIMWCSSLSVPIEADGRLLWLPWTRAAARQQSSQMPKANGQQLTSRPRHMMKVNFDGFFGFIYQE